MLASSTVSFCSKTFWGLFKPETNCFLHVFLCVFRWPRTFERCLIWENTWLYFKILSLPLTESASWIPPSFQGIKLMPPCPPTVHLWPFDEKPRDKRLHFCSQCKRSDEENLLSLLQCLQSWHANPASCQSNTHALQAVKSRGRKRKNFSWLIPALRLHGKSYLPHTTTSYTGGNLSEIQVLQWDGESTAWILI